MIQLAVLCGQMPSCVQFFVTPWTVAHQVPLSMGYSRQEYWSGLPFPPPGDLPDPGVEPASPHCMQILTAEPPGKVYLYPASVSEPLWSQAPASSSSPAPTGKRRLL